MDRHEISAEKRHLSRLPWSPFLAGAVTEVSDATDLSLVLEPIPRESFQQLIHQFGFLKLASTIATLIRAIWFIHSHGLVSRDINPGNVLVGHDGYLVMTGLGVAEREREGRSWLDMETTQYMAPELIRQGYPVGRTVGWWASGVMLYEMPHPNDGISNLTAQFTGDSDHPVFHDILTLNYEWPREPVLGNSLKHVVAHVRPAGPARILRY